MAETVFTNIRARGTLAVVGIATLASAAVSSVINFTGDDGVVLQDSGVTQDQILPITCSNTGGLAKYDTCVSASPLSTTGTITEISLHCGANPKPFAYDLGFVKALNSATGAGIQNLNNKTSATGATQAFLTGSLLWNPVDYLKLGTLTSVPTTSGNACQLRVRLFDSYGE